MIFGRLPSKLQLLCGCLRGNWESLALFLPSWPQVRVFLIYIKKIKYIIDADEYQTVCTFAIFRISPFVGRAFAAWNKGIEERVSLTSSILGNMKEVKLLGLTDRWAMDIQDYRVKELNLSKKARILSVYRLVLGEYPTLSG
jgi:hypothetical protein